MTTRIVPEPPRCPRCLHPAMTRETRYGYRHQCCGLHSWDGKPLVSQEVHDARQRCHALFDPIWKNAESLYRIEEPEGTEAHDTAVRRIRKAMRNRAYYYLAHVTQLPEPECHMSNQADLRKLALLERAMKDMTPAIVRDWWRANNKPQPAKSGPRNYGISGRVFS